LAIGGAKAGAVVGGFFGGLFGGFGGVVAGVPAGPPGLAGFGVLGAAEGGFQGAVGDALVGGLVGSVLDNLENFISYMSGKKGGNDNGGAGPSSPNKSGAAATPLNPEDKSNQKAAAGVNTDYKHFESRAETKTGTVTVEGRVTRSGNNATVHELDIRGPGARSVGSAEVRGIGKQMADQVWSQLGITSKAAFTGGANNGSRPLWSTRNGDV